MTSPGAPVPIADLAAELALIERAVAEAKAKIAGGQGLWLPALAERVAVLCDGLVAAGEAARMHLPRLDALAGALDELEAELRRRAPETPS